MSVDDILFEPIDLNKAKILVDQDMIDAVKVALTGISALEFMVDPDISIDTYNEIADLVENDSLVVKYTGQMVKRDTYGIHRPAGALTIKEVFHRIHRGEDEFYFCAKANGQGVIKEKFTNWFGIDSQIPILHVDDLTGNAGGFFEWWIVGLMSQFCGYNQYYGFTTEAEARKYYAIP